MNRSIVFIKFDSYKIFVKTINLFRMEGQTNVPIAKRLETDEILGQDVNEDSYSRMPISNFGMNLLKSMGWQEGKAIGRNTENIMVKPVEYVPNYDRAGLGARKEALPSYKKKRRTEHIVQPDENGKIKNYIEIGADKPKKVEKNSRVKITAGKYKGEKGIVTSMNETKKECYIELEINEELVKIDLDKVKLYRAEQEEEEYVDFEKVEEHKDDGSINGKRSITDRASEDRNSYKDSETSKVSKKSKKDKKKKKKDKKDKKRLKWITTNIMVRVISKKVRNGKLYEKKVYISDILDEYSFSAIDDKGNTVDELREKDVETIMPKPNDLVKVLVGEERDKVAVMLERDKKNNQVLVQFVDTMELGTYKQDDCSQYVDKT